MTIDEVIERNRERAEKINEKANEQKGLNYGFNLLYKEHAEEYEQIIEWLEDYKKLKSIDEDLRLKYCYEDLSDAAAFVAAAVCLAIFSCISPFTCANSIAASDCCSICSRVLA